MDHSIQEVCYCLYHRTQGPEKNLEAIIRRLEKNAPKFLHVDYVEGRNRISVWFKEKDLKKVRMLVEKTQIGSPPAAAGSYLFQAPSTITEEPILGQSIGLDKLQELFVLVLPREERKVTGQHTSKGVGTMFQVVQYTVFGLA